MSRRLRMIAAIAWLALASIMVFVDLSVGLVAIAISNIWLAANSLDTQP